MMNNLADGTRSTATNDCPQNVKELVCVHANVTITPIIEVGEVIVRCTGRPQIGSCSGAQSLTSCDFTVSQKVCVDIPLEFSANAEARSTGIKCGAPTSGACPSSVSCTYTIGFYKNHPVLTDSLIKAVGGIIVLGIDSQGTSFTVTPEIVDSVLSLKTPAPPAPITGSFAMQYQQLYAQLLAANLNVINGADCALAKTAISNANKFLATSPFGIGKAGAPLYASPLALFNEGMAPGCPVHCPSI